MGYSYVRLNNGEGTKTPSHNTTFMLYLIFAALLLSNLTILLLYHFLFWTDRVSHTWEEIFKAVYPMFLVFSVLLALSTVYFINK